MQVKLSSEYILRRINEEIILINQRESKMILRFNNTGREIIEHIVKTGNVDLIKNSLVSKYNQCYEDISKDIDDFFKELIEARIIEVIS